MWRTSCVSQAKARNPNRWTSVTVPSDQSAWCRFSASTPASAEVRGVPLERRRCQAALAGGVHEAHVRQLVPQCAQHLGIGRAHPQPSTPRRSARATSSHRPDDGRLLGVDRKLEVRAAGLVEIGEPRDVVRGQLRRRCAPRPRKRRRPRRNTRVVHEHDLAVGREPGVALEPRRPQLPRAPERRERVLRALRSCTAVGKCDDHGLRW